MSAWEIAQLADRTRIALDLPASEWVTRFLGLPGIAEAPLTTTAAARAYSLPDFPHRDPADRLLVCLALELQCPLVTYDGQIRSFIQAAGATLGLSLAEAYPA